MAAFISVLAFALATALAAGLTTVAVIFCADEAAIWNAITPPKGPAAFAIV
jgi:hypothetical protein